MKYTGGEFLQKEKVMSNINPDIKEIIYGKKELKTLSIYPLSVGDQFTLTDIITEVAIQLIDAKNKGTQNDYSFMASVLEIIQEKIGKVLSLVADVSEEEAANIIKNLTNNQLMEIIDIVWTVNYEESLKKGQSLLEKGKSVFSSRKSLQDSSNGIHNIGSNTSTEEVSEKVV